MTSQAQHSEDPYTGSLTPAERIASADIDILENGASPEDAYRGLERYLPEHPQDCPCEDCELEANPVYQATMRSES